MQSSRGGHRYQMGVPHLQILPLEAPLYPLIQPGPTPMAPSHEAQFGNTARQHRV